MNGDQTTAFLSASGADASNLKALFASMVVALALLWAAWVMRDTGFQMLYGKMRMGAWMMYTIRALILVMVLVVLVTT